MHAQIFATIFTVMLITSSCSSRQTVRPTKLSSSNTHSISRAVDDLINSTDPNVNIGVSIRSLTSDKTIYEKNASRHFVPCSTMKIVTLAAALHYLGPSYRFTTKIFTDVPIKADGVINNIYVQGSGDPSLMDYDLKNLAQELAQRGITRITGDVLVDDEIFDDVLWGRGDMWDDRNKGYAAPVAGINLNYNRIQIKTMPNLEGKGPAVPILWPKTQYVDVASEAKTVESGISLSYAIERGKSREDWPQSSNDGLKRGDTIIVKGQIGKNTDGHYSLLAVNDPGTFAATVLKEELQRLGVKVDGSIGRRATPDKAVKLTQHQSRSLAEALIDFTKISNNVAHDTLVKAIAADAGIKPATAAAGLKRIGEFMEKEIGITANSLVAADGAGLSRYNLITPEQMVKLLEYSANHFHMGAEFMSALSFGGEDGLLKSRLTMENVKGQIRAKTGTMSGLSNIVGYLTDEKGERYAFAIMINGFVGSGAPYTALQDKILSSMLVDDQNAVANVK